MTTYPVTAEHLRSFVEHAPKNVTTAPGLAGFTGFHFDVCATCAARLTARGFGSALKGFVPVWDTPSEVNPTAPTTIGTCAVCDKP